jgi:hypothetical protein
MDYLHLVHRHDKAIVCTAGPCMHQTKGQGKRACQPKLDMYKFHNADYKLHTFLNTDMKPIRQTIIFILEGLRKFCLFLFMCPIFCHQQQDTEIAPKIGKALEEHFLMLPFFGFNQCIF